MKRLIAYLLLPAAALVSCNKTAAPDKDSPADKEYTLLVDDLEFATKTTEISSIPSTLFWCATTGSVGTSETQKYASTSATVTSSKIHTGKYQTAKPTEYNWYVCNKGLNVPTSAGSVTVTCSNDLDVIAGVCKSSTATPSVTLNHIFSRTGTLTLNTQQYSTTANYKLSDVSWKIQSKSGGTGGTAGTYNAGANSWSSVTALPQQVIGTAVPSSTTDNVAVHSSDLYCIPGEYTMTVSYRLSKYNNDSTIDYYKDFTKSADVTLTAGKVNNITATAKGAEAQEIVISVSLTQWGTNEIAMEL